ncbi:MAG: hypothetical protein EB084_01055 [Proteobacteria bacterium]|nr:hypothetical protein [Pseudomonadota bacterium]
MIIKGKRGEHASEEEPRLAPAAPQGRESALIKSKGAPLSAPEPLPTARRSSLVKRGTYSHTEADEAPQAHAPGPVDETDRVVIPTGDRPAPAPIPAFSDPSEGGHVPPPSMGPPVDQQIIEEAKRRAEAIMRQAQLDARKLLEESKIHCQNALEQAEREGYVLGQQKGYEASTSEMVELILQIRQMLGDVVYAREKVLRSSEGAVAHLALQIAERVTQTAVTVNPEIIKNQVSFALEKVKDREHVTVRVNPEDLDVVRARRDMFQKILEGPKTFEINGDPKVDRGGVIIETNLGNVDARISTQLQALHVAVMEVEKRMQEEWERAAIAAREQAMQLGLPPHLAEQAQLPPLPPLPEFDPASMVDEAQHWEGAVEPDQVVYEQAPAYGGEGDWQAQTYDPAVMSPAQVDPSAGWPQEAQQAPVQWSAPVAPAELGQTQVEEGAPHDQ